MRPPQKHEEPTRGKLSFEELMHKILIKNLTIDLSMDKKVLSMNKKILSMDKKVLCMDKKVLSIDEKVLSIDKKILSMDKKYG